jgi:D-alanyl-D-alanine carboxypeptidase
MKFFSLIFLLLFTANQAFAGVAIAGCGNVYSQLVFDAKTQNILSETRSDKIAYPASLTKLMTLYLTFEALKAGKIKLDDEIIVSQRGEEISAINRNTTLHLKEGDKITVEQAIKGSIVKSFNEASVSLAERVAGDEWQFVRMMNDKAFALGMFNTSFRNSTGFHEDGQYTTAYDLARLTIALRRDFPRYYPLFALRTFEYKGRKFQTHNHVLLEYKGAEGMKTGYTKAAGFNLISSAVKKPFEKKSTKKSRKKDMHITNNRESQELEERVISIVMGCPSVKSRDNFTKKLLDSGFDNIKSFGKNALVSKVNSGFNYDDVEVEKLEFEVEKADMVSEEMEIEFDKSVILKKGAEPLSAGFKVEEERAEIEIKNPKTDKKKFELKKVEAEVGEDLKGEKVKEKSPIKKENASSKSKKSEVKKGKVEAKVKKPEAKKGKGGVKKNADKKLEVKKKSKVKKTELKKKKSEAKKSQLKKEKRETKKP